MKIVMYCKMDLYRPICESWRAIFMRHGLEAEFLEIPREWTGKLPEVEDSSINLFMGGISMFWPFSRSGFPAHGKNVIWIFEPLTLDPGAAYHYPKTLEFNKSAAGFDALIAMDGQIARFCETHFPQSKTYLLPHSISEDLVCDPLPEAQRSIDILCLAHESARRAAAARDIVASGLQARFVWGGLWGDASYRAISASRISLQIFRDSHTYFDQFRIFTAWARGSVVVSEPFEALGSFGALPGIHLEVAELAQFPTACAALLKNAEKRAAIAASAQTLLRKSYLPDHYAEKMLSILSAVAANRRAP